MAKQAGRACQRFWERRGPRWSLGGGLAAVVVLLLFTGLSTPAAFACGSPVQSSPGHLYDPSGGVAGGTLTTTNGLWSGCAPTGFDYQWQRSTNGGASWSNILGAPDAQTYSPVGADVDALVRAEVSGSSPYGSSGLKPDSDSSAIYESALGLRREYTPTGNVSIDDQESLQVNVADGNLTLEANDFSLPGVAGLGYQFSRSYNSLNNTGLSMASDLSTLANPTLGVGWSDVPDLALFASGDARYADSTGYEITFKNVSGAYTSPPGSDATLVLSGGTYELTFYKAGIEEDFNSSGQLTDEYDRSRNHIAFSWSGGHLSTVTDTTGRATTFHYTSGNMTSITAPGSCYGPSGFYGTAYSAGGSLASNVYYYEVTAVTAAGEWTASLETNIAVNGPTGEVSLHWNAVPGATSYRIYRGTSAGGENTYYTSSTNSFTDTGATGTSATPPAQFGTCLYYYGYSGSPAKLTSFADPASGKTTTYAYDTYGLLQTVTNPLGNKWTIAYSGPNRVSSITRSLDTIAAPTGTASTSGGSLATGTYYFKVSAIAAGHPVRLSGELSKAVTGPNGKVALSWAAVPGATSYRVYRGPSSGNENVYHTSSTTSYTDTGGGTSGSPPSSQTSFTYQAPSGMCSVGMETDVTDPDNNVTKYCTDGRGRVISVTEPLGNYTFTDYTDTGFGGANCTDGNGKTLDDKPCATIDARNHVTQYGYDSTGQNLVWEESPTQSSSNRSSWQYTDPNNLYAPSYFTDANNDPPTHYTYTTSGLLSTQTDPLGNTTSYCYDDANGELIYKFSPLAGTVDCSNPPTNYRTTYSYYTTNGSLGTIGDLYSVTDPLGNETTYTYDEAGHQVTKTEPLGNGNGRYGYTVADSYDADGRKVFEENERGYNTTYAYDAAGNLSTTADALARITTDCYGPSNQVIAEYDPKAGAVNCASPPSSNVTRYSYDGAGNQIVSTDQLGNTTTDCYDADNELAAEYSPLAGAVSSCSATTYKTSFTYDANGNQLTVTSTMTGSQSATTTSTYYPDDSLWTVTDGDGNEQTYTYDYVGNQTSELDSKTGQTSTEKQTFYNADNQVSSVTSGLDSSGVCPTAAPPAPAPVCPKTTYTYDANGNLATETSPNNQPSGPPTSYCYDQANERIYEFSPLAGVVNCASPPTNYRTTYAYDANGRLQSKQTAMGTITYGYDEAGDSTSKTYQNASGNNNPATPNVSYTYDGVGNRLTMSDGGSGTVSYAYDPLNNLCAVIRGGTANCTTPVTGTLSYTYNAAEEITNRTYPDGTSITETPDANGNLASVASGGVTTFYTYDQDNNLATTTLPAMGGNTFASTLTYDNAEQLANDTTKKNGSTVLAGFQYTPDQFGSPTAVSRTGSLTCGTTNTYNNDERLATATYSGSNCPTNNSDATSFTYTYDADGNITEATGDATATYYAYNVADEICNSSPSANPTCASPQYTYDANGNETYDPSTGRSYEYDLENRVISETSGAQTTTYTYDGDGTLLTVTPASGATINYAWDTNTDDGVPNLILETGGSTNRNIYGNGLISDYNSTAGQTQYYVADGLGSAVNTLSSTNGNTNWTYTYDPYGGQRYGQNSGTQPNEMQYAGYRVDPAVSTVYDSATRQYDTGSGRFLSQDPLGTPGQTASTYSYADDNPSSGVDPSGECTVLDPSIWHDACGIPPGCPRAMSKESQSLFTDFARIIFRASDRCRGHHVAIAWVHLYRTDQPFPRDAGLGWTRWARSPHDRRWYSKTEKISDYLPGFGSLAQTDVYHYDYLYFNAQWAFPPFYYRDLTPVRYWWFPSEPCYPYDSFSPMAAWLGDIHYCEI